MLGVIACLAGRAHGAFLAGGNGTQNTTQAGSGLSRWDNVFQLGIGTAVYLGDGWVLTAQHVQGGVGPTTFTIAGQTYAQDGDFHQLHNSNGTHADLAIMHLTGDPGLQSVQIGQSPTVGTDIKIVGAGANRAISKTYWNVSGPPNYVWTVSASPTMVSGYLYGSGKSKRWGTNTTSARER